MHDHWLDGVAPPPPPRPNRLPGRALPATNDILATARQQYPLPAGPPDQRAPARRVPEHEHQPSAPSSDHILEEVSADFVGQELAMASHLAAGRKDPMAEALATMAQTRRC